MGLFTGRYARINISFFLLVMLFCLIGRACNIFPLSYLANFGRKQVIPLNMQVVMWFAGLRGAIAFALSQNLPNEHKDVYISTTLAIVIFTTIVCGGLTEPMLNRMEMRTTMRASSASIATINASSSSTINPLIGGKNADNVQYEPLAIYDASIHSQASTTETDSVASAAVSGLNRIRRVATRHRQNFIDKYSAFISRIEDEYMHPLFGGPEKTSVHGTSTCNGRTAIDEDLRSASNDESIHSSITLPISNDITNSSSTTTVHRKFSS